MQIAEFIRLQTNYKDIRDKAVATQKTSSVIITQITGLHNFWNTVKTALDTVPTTLDSTSPNAYKKVAFLWKSAPSLKVSMGEIVRDFVCPLSYIKLRFRNGFERKLKTLTQSSF